MACSLVPVANTRSPFLIESDIDENIMFLVTLIFSDFEYKHRKHFFYSHFFVAENRRKVMWGEKKIFMTGMRLAYLYFHMKFQSAISCQLNIMMKKLASRISVPWAMEGSLHDVSSKFVTHIAESGSSHFFHFGIFSPVRCGQIRGSSDKSHKNDEGPVESWLMRRD